MFRCKHTAEGGTALLNEYSAIINFLATTCKSIASDLNDLLGKITFKPIPNSDNVVIGKLSRIFAAVYQTDRPIINVLKIFFVLTDLNQLFLVYYHLLEQMYALYDSCEESVNRFEKMLVAQTKNINSKPTIRFTESKIPSSSSSSSSY